jgi:hypothetical protein
VSDFTAKRVTGLSPGDDMSRQQATLVAKLSTRDE